eukprot:7835648-Pyramimonas_sp.AAC.1
MQRRRTSRRDIIRLCSAWQSQSSNSQQWQRASRLDALNAISHRAEQDPKRNVSEFCYVPGCLFVCSMSFLRA